MSRVVVLGGGYAGLSCLIELHKADKNLDLHLVDADTSHCKLTSLHKTFQEPVENYRVAYQELADKYDFTFHCHRCRFTREDLTLWQQRKSLPLAGSELAFDWLVISTGASPVELTGEKEGFGQAELRRGEGTAFIERLVAERQGRTARISLVGGGATGIQIVFELQELLRKRGVPNSIRLVDLNSRLVPDLPEGVHRYIVKKMSRAGIEYLADTKYLGHNAERIRLEERESGRIYDLPTTLTLLFPGVTAAPFALETNEYGQVMSEGQVMPAILSAGDCSTFNSSGLNLLTAQAAVRKGKLVARNIVRLCHGGSLQRYCYQEKGYLISLGSTDAVGWIGLRCNLVKGFPASFIKDAMESQYNLFLGGIDTYLRFP